MSRFIYTKEMIEYIKSIAPGRFNKEITKMFNEKFELNKTVSAINSMKSNHGIKSGKLPKQKRLESRLLTKEQDEFLRDNVIGIGNKELAELMNSEFNLNLTTEQIKSYKANYSLSSGLTGQFDKDHEPWNKGMKGYCPPGSEKGWFKKGQESHNKLPVGTEVVVDEGYKETKIAEPNVWKRNHIILWEKEHGEIPDNHVVLFLDQDKGNIIIDNLAMVHRRELAMLNQRNLLSKNAEETLVGISVVRLKGKINEIERMGNDRETYDKHRLIAERNGISETAFTARIKRGWTLHDATYKPLNSVSCYRANRSDQHGTTKISRST